MDQKTIGAIIAIIGGVGAVASIGVMLLIPGSCPQVMTFYHQILLILLPFFFITLVLGVYLYFKPEEVRVKRIVSARKIEGILAPDERRVMEFLKGGRDSGRHTQGARHAKSNSHRTAAAHGKEKDHQEGKDREDELRGTHKRILIFWLIVLYLFDCSASFTIVH